MKVLILNSVCLNTGDAAILQGEMRILRDALGDDVEFVVLDKNAEAARRYYPEVTFDSPLSVMAARPRLHGRIWGPMRRIHRARVLGAARLEGLGARLAARALLSARERDVMDLYRAADLVVGTGGTMLVENYSLTPRILDIRVAQLLHRPVVLFTQSVGRIVRRANRRRLARVMRGAALVLVRGDLSRGHLEELPGKINVAKSADPAFALVDERAIETRAWSASLPRRVAFSLRAWRFFEGVDPEEGHRRYLEAFRLLAMHLVERWGVAVTCVSSCQGAPEYWADDSRTAAEMVAGLPAEVRASVDVDGGFRTPEQLRDFLGTFDLVVATRLHVAILALATGTPAFSIAYEFKTGEVFAALGWPEWVQDIESLTPDSLISAVDAAVASLPSLRGRLFASVMSESRRAFAAGDLTRDVVRLPVGDRRPSEDGSGTGEPRAPVRPRVELTSERNRPRWP